jgi:hypothetical protein
MKWAALRPCCLGAHENLTTCAPIELTTLKTRFAMWRAVERSIIIRDEGA